MPSLIFDKCCGCIDLKTGCFIIGYLNLVADIIMLTMTGLTLGTGMAMIHSGKPEYHEPGVVIVATAAIVLVFLILFLAFAIILVVGLHQNKPGHVKAFLIYGAIFTVLYAINLIVTISAGPAKAINIIQQIISLLLNIYFLLVIRSQYYHMKDGTSRGPAIYNTA